MRAVLSGLLLLAAALGQRNAALTGVVTDPTGKPVPGARVTLRNASRTQLAGAVSDAQGKYELRAIEPGAYLLETEKAGFAALQTAIRVTEGKAVQQNVQLSLSRVESSVTVSAETSMVETLDNTAQRVTVLSRNVLEERGVMTLTEATEGEMGVHSLKTSPALGSVFVRGMTGKNVAVFRDGVRTTTSAQRGGISTFLNLNDPSQIESVEVLRGANSAQYGSDSLGGTLSLQSRAASYGTGWHGEWAPFFNSASNGFGGAGLLSGGGEKDSFTLNLAARRGNTVRTGGGYDTHAAVTRFLGLPSTVMGERLPDTGFTQYGGSLHYQRRLNERQQFTGRYERNQQDGGKRYDQLLGGDGNLIADMRNLMFDFGYARWQAQRLAGFDSAQFTASFNAQREERVNQGGQGNPLGAISSQYEKLKAWGLQFHVAKIKGEHSLLLGGEGYRESVAAPSHSWNPATGAVSLVRPRVPDGALYRQYGLFVQDVWQPEGARWLRMSGALRFGGASYESRAANSALVNGRRLWPDDSLAANAISGRAGVVVRPNDHVSFHSQYSRGFRVPNMTDLGSVGLQGSGAFEAAVSDLAGRGALLGDRADDRAAPSGKQIAPLRPESSDNFDMGVQARAGRVKAELTAFWMNLGNSIVSQTLLLPQGAPGQTLGDQTISRQLASGAVFVPISTSPVLARANSTGARNRGIEQSLRVKLHPSFTLNQSLTYIYSEDERSGLPPDIEPGIPPLTVNASMLWTPPSQRWWLEAYGLAADRQERLSSLALADRRIGAPRSLSNIQSFFNNGARVRGLTANGRLLATNETLAEVQSRVLGTAPSAPMFTAIPGYAVFGVRGGMPMGTRNSIMVDFSNLADKNYRGIGWGIDGPGRGITIRWEMQF